MRRLALTALCLTILALAACADRPTGAADPAGPAYDSGDKAGTGGGGGGGSM